MKTSRTYLVLGHFVNLPSCQMTLNRCNDEEGAEVDKMSSCRKGVMPTTLLFKQCEHSPLSVIMLKS
jgi:hypothetical protein